MEFGILAFPQEDTVAPDAIAVAAEERGFESIWYPEHSHFPLDSSNWPGGENIPDGYARTLDQFICLTAAAAATSTIKLGTGICLVPQHNATWLAKRVATLDVLSGGRVLLGIGFGWNPAELGDHGVAFKDRREITRETILAAKALWTEEVASFDGDHVSVRPSKVWPKPIQKPHPPIIIGAGAGPKLYAAVAEYADGWGPMRGRDEVDAHVGPVRAAFADAGRDPDTLDITVFSAPQNAEDLSAMAAAGATRAVFVAPAGNPDKLHAALDAIAALRSRIS